MVYMRKTGRSSKKLQRKCKYKRGKLPPDVLCAHPEQDRGRGMSDVLVHHFVCTATAGERVWLGFEGKTHTQDVTHRFA
jgi:hypothetical protein